MSKMKEKYQLEYDKYKEIKITPQRYKLKSNQSIMYEVLEVNEKFEKVYLRTIHSQFESTKTLHWCRKNLVPV